MIGDVHVSKDGALFREGRVQDAHGVVHFVLLTGVDRMHGPFHLDIRDTTLMDAKSVDIELLSCVTCLGGLVTWNQKTKEQSKDVDDID